MNMGLMLRNFIDAGWEGDGLHILRCIKFFLLHFRQDGSGSTKYALESLYHLFQVYAMLTPREAERLTWNCTVNTKGVRVTTYSWALTLNMTTTVTERLRSLGANVSETSVNRICRAFFLIIKLFQRLACELNICRNSGEHTKKNLHRDVMTVVEEFVREDVFTKKIDRAPLKFFSQLSPRLFTTLRYQFII